MVKIKISIDKLPPYAKIIIAIVPSIIIVIIAFIVIISPKNREIKDLEAQIIQQENELAKSQSKAEKLPELIAINEQLKKRLNELKKQLPEEKEISNLLKQVSDYAINSGLKILLWKPQDRKLHSSGIVYEIPVRVELLGSYHNLGYFFSNLTKLDRIINISDLKLSTPKMERAYAVLDISFTATTFSAVPEEEIGKEPVKKRRGRKRKRT